MGDLFVHYGKIEKGSISIGQNVNLEIDVLKRNNSKAYHSATHLLHESLRRTLGKHVTQKGSLVSPERLRFDFSHNKPIEKEEMTKINKHRTQLYKWLKKANHYVAHSDDIRSICNDYRGYWKKSLKRRSGDWEDPENGGRIFCERISKHLSKPSYPGGTWCYAVTLEGAKKILRIFDNKVDDHLDGYYMEKIQDGTINAVAFDPPIVWHAGGAERTDSDIPWDW